MAEALLGAPDINFLNFETVHGPVEEECKVIIIQIKIKQFQPWIMTSLNLVKVL